MNWYLQIWPGRWRSNFQPETRPCLSGRTYPFRGEAEIDQASQNHPLKVQLVFALVLDSTNSPTPSVF